ncbi:cytochrome P450 78A5-like [Gastrolobium bilobum]|uniref:cytochrome P450 78A5-like n=1 Tax=Gastrolobium bilobum TaxID=150636 RepID=UPI002AB0159F|nr:cytochrome P450 78A5-like [Gastrolobium bilobum]
MIPTLVSSCSWSLVTLFLSTFLPLLAISLNYWLVPGGYAWRNYYNRYKKHYYTKLPGPIGWPILGTLPEMGSLAHRKLATMANSLNAKRLMVLSLGTNPVVISSHPDTARDILYGSSFSDRPVKESARVLMFERAIGFAPYGNYWRHLRKVATTHMFSPRVISGLESLRQHVAAEMVMRTLKEMGDKGVVEVRGILHEGSLSNVLESVFGTNNSSMSSETKDVLSDMVKEGYDLIGKFNWEDYFPFKFLDFHGVKRRCHNLAAKVNDVVGQIVEERKRCGEFVGQNDFLSALLSLPHEERLCDSDIVAILWEMIFRGTDTVAMLLEWIMAMMVLHQDIQMKARQEIDTCVGLNGHVRDSDIPNLPYLQAIVKEVLRLHPPGPLLSWARLAIHDVHVDKVMVPAGTTAMVNMWAITHDSSIWDDPWAFKPERFMKEDVSIMGSDLRLAPFGAGRRVCPGKALGLATVHLWLAKLLQHFIWLPVKPVDLSECLKLSLEMKKPLRCQVICRRITPKSQCECNACCENLSLLISMSGFLCDFNVKVGFQLFLVLFGAQILDTYMAIGAGWLFCRALGFSEFQLVYFEILRCRVYRVRLIR